MQSTSSPVQGMCSKCGAEALILSGHLGKPHKKCRQGKWIKKPKIQEPKEESDDKKDSNT